jgi:hypothetical protein
MGQIAISLGGAGIGFLLGGPTGAQIGWLIGSLASNLLDRPKIYGPRLNDLKVSGADYGHMRPILYGTMRIAGLGCGQGSTVNGPNKFTENEEKSGGKGGPEQINYTYQLSFFNEICEGVIAGVWRRWANGRLITEGGAPASESWPYVLYLGTASQMPDPTMETIYGTGEVSPMRGTAYEAVEEVQIQDFGNARPNVEYEAYTAEGVFPWRVSTFQVDSAGLQLYSPTATYEGGTISVAWGGRPSYIATRYHAEYKVDGTVVTPLWGGDSDAFFGIIGAHNDPTWTDGSVIDPLTGLPVPGVTVYDEVKLFHPVRQRFIYFQGISQFGLMYWNVSATAGDIDCVIRIDNFGQPSLFQLGTTNFPPVDIAGGVQAGGMTIYTSYVADRNGIPGALPLYELEIVETPTAINVSIRRQWDLDAEYTIQQIINGAQFSVYQNRAGRLVLACSAGSGAGTQCYCYYLNDDLTVTAIGGIDVGFFGAQHRHPIALLGAGPYMLWADGVICLEPPPALVILGDIVADIMRRCGYTPNQYDVTDLTQEVRGYVLGSQMTGFNAIDTLRSCYFFDAGDAGDHIVFRNRGHSATETIPDEDLCAHIPGSQKPEPLKVTRGSEQELPRTVFINYYDYDHDYQQGSQYWRRTVTGSQTDTTLDLPLSLTAGEAQQIAQWHMHFAWIERDHFEFYTYKKWEKLIPTDVVVVRGINIRITKKTVTPGHIIKFEGVRAFAGGFIGGTVSDPINGQIPGGGGGGQPPQNPPSTAADTALVLIDGPWISEADPATSIHAALYPGSTGSWPGASLYKSVDVGTTYASVATLSSASIVGTVATATPTFLGGNVVDEGNVITVVLASGTLSSTTEAGIQNGLNLFALGTVATGWEFVQFRTATLTATNTYQLTGLLRGRYGTEWMMPLHAADEIFVLISSTVRVDGSTAEIGLSRKWKPVTYGASLASATVTDFTNTGVALKPRAPVNIGGGRDASGNVTLNWTPRRRGSGGWPDGVDLPLTETPEAYVVHIYTTSGYSTIVRYIGVGATTTASYTAAMQTTDFGSPQATIYWDVVQAGAIGYGYAARGIT